MATAILMLWALAMGRASLSDEKSEPLIECGKAEVGRCRGSNMVFLHSGFVGVGDKFYYSFSKMISLIMSNTGLISVMNINRRI